MNEDLSQRSEVNETMHMHSSYGPKNPLNFSEKNPLTTVPILRHRHHMGPGQRKAHNISKWAHINVALLHKFRTCDHEGCRQAILGFWYGYQS